MSDDTSGRGFRWQALFQRAEEPLFVLDRRRRLLFVNRAWSRLTDLPLDRARCLVCRRPVPIGADDTPEERIAHLLTPPAEALRGQIAQVRRLFLARNHPQPQWWDVEFLPLRQAGPRDGYLILGRILPRPVELPAPLFVLPERLEELRLRRTARYSMELLESNLPSMKRLQAQARLACQVDAPTFLRGEPGSGKRTLARIIHFQSRRRESRFVSLDPRRLPTAILDDLLRNQREAIGTLYLSSPELLPRDLQANLATWTLTHPSRMPRIIVGAASLDELHEALAWQLATLTIDVPPLRERLEDLPELLRILDAPPISPEAMEALKAHPWRGNLKELRQVTTRAAQRKSGDRIELADLPMAFREARLLEAEPQIVPRSLPLEQTLTQVEERLIRLALRRSGGNRSRAAELLGVHRPRLLRRMEALGIQLQDQGD